MLNPRIEPWLNKDDYDAFKKLAPDDPDLPPTFDEWLENALDKLSAFVKSGVPIERIDISPIEFKNYCDAASINPDGVARAAFAVSKITKART